MRNKRNLKRVLLLMIIVCASCLCAGCKKTMIDLNKYINITSYGCDSLGHVSYSFDYDAFVKDNSALIKLKSKDKDELERAALESTKADCELLYDFCIKCEIDKTEGLNNGDVVNLKWNCDVEMAEEYFNCELNFSDIEYKVSNLTEVEMVNPFDDIEVSYTGIAPNGHASFKTKEDKYYLTCIDFELNKHSDLKNGDMIAITAKLNCSEEEFIDMYEMKLEKSNKSYIVEGLDYYVQKMDEIPKNLFDKMNYRGEEAFRSYVNNVWNKPENLQSVTFKGNYFMTKKDGSDEAVNNYLFFVYEIKAINPKPEEEVNFYYYVGYKDIIMLRDGTCAVDLSNCIQPSNTEFFYVDNYKYSGYTDLDELYHFCVTDIGDFNCESNVQ